MPSTASNAAPSLPRTIAIVFAALGSVGFSGKAIVAKLLFAQGLDATTVLMLRMLLAMPLFGLLLLWARYQKPNAPALTPRQWVLVAVLGFLGYYLASYLDFLGLQYISVTLERLILYLNPTLVLLLGWLIWGKRITAVQALAAAVSYAGVLLVVGHEWRFDGARTLLGSLLVLGSALSYALYLMGSSRIVDSVGPLRLVALACLCACVLCIVQFFVIHAVPWATLQAVGSSAWGLSLINATLCTVLPVALVMLAVQRLGAPTAAQIGLIGPISTLLMGAWWLGERITLQSLVGCALVLAGVMWVSVRK